MKNINMNQLSSLRPKFRSFVNLKLLLLGLFLLLILFITLKSNLSSYPYPQTTLNLSNPIEEAQDHRSIAIQEPSCNKIHPSLANAIIHYASSNNTPQQTLKEISITAQVLEKKSPCNFLVFGLGHDSLMWKALNHGGRTVFLEEDKAWIETVRRQLPTLELYHVMYSTKVSDAEELLDSAKLPECTTIGDMRFSRCPLALKGLPDVFYEQEWDLIMVDAPTGYVPEAPGRMGSIYMAGMAARGRKEGETDVFVHDVNRFVEDKFSKALWCEGYMKQQEGLLRHFTIPSHRGTEGMPFCPR